MRMSGNQIKAPDIPAGKKRVCILVTDSGLGGASVLAEIAKGLSNSAWEQVSLIYFNAWPEPERGYNHFPDMAYRAGVFDNALRAMAALKPDLILVACNTLSVIYGHTTFSFETAIPVSGIVDHGVNALERALKTDPVSRAIIFGTPTTARAEVHTRELVKRGISSRRLLTRGCTNLAGKIERNPFGPEVRQMIKENVKATAAGFSHEQGKVLAALCCTHFGYCATEFQDQMKRIIGPRVEIINPNTEMARQVLDACPKKTKGPTPRITIRMMSRVVWDPRRIAAYERLLSPDFPEVAAALKNYEYNPGLFKETLK